MTVLAALGAVLALVSGCGSDSPGKPDPSPTGASSSASTIPAQHHLVRFADANGEGGVVLESPADTSKLDGVPEEFKAFIAAELLKQQTASGTAMTDCHPKDQLIVDVIDPAGHAAGRVEFAACTGARLYWAKVDGKWRKVLGGQVYPQCDAFKQYGFPVSVAGDKCSKGTEIVAYSA
ncbi:hypothetical protein [Aeromicrobium sp.]|uniref:hypothetical protein n=1 Tax=Aeromicrobium sp. TaxID=1871063 RepID=UPI002FC8CDFF